MQIVFSSQLSLYKRLRYALRLSEIARDPHAASQRASLEVLEFTLGANRPAFSSPAAIINMKDDIEKIFLALYLNRKLGLFPNENKHFDEIKAQLAGYQPGTKPYIAQLQLQINMVSAASTKEGYQSACCHYKKMKERVSTSQYFSSLHFDEMYLRMFYHSTAESKRDISNFISASPTLTSDDFLARLNQHDTKLMQKMHAPLCNTLQQVAAPYFTQHEIKAIISGVLSPDNKITLSKVELEPMKTPQTAVADSLPFHKRFWDKIRSYQRPPDPFLAYVNELLAAGKAGTFLTQDNIISLYRTLRASNRLPHTAVEQAKIQATAQSLFGYVPPTRLWKGDVPDEKIAFLNDVYSPAKKPSPSMAWEMNEWALLLEKYHLHSTENMNLFYVLLSLEHLNIALLGKYIKNLGEHLSEASNKQDRLNDFMALLLTRGKAPKPSLISKEEMLLFSSFKGNTHAQSCFISLMRPLHTTQTPLTFEKESSNHHWDRLIQITAHTSGHEHYPAQRSVQEDVSLLLGHQVDPEHTLAFFFNQTLPLMAQTMQFFGSKTLSPSEVRRLTNFASHTPALLQAMHQEHDARAASAKGNNIFHVTMRYFIWHVHPVHDTPEYQSKYKAFLDLLCIICPDQLNISREQQQYLLTVVLPKAAHKTAVIEEINILIQGFTTQISDHQKQTAIRQQLAEAYIQALLNNTRDGEIYACMRDEVNMQKIILGMTKSIVKLGGDKPESCDAPSGMGQIGQEYPGSSPVTSYSPLQHMPIKV